MALFALSMLWETVPSWTKTVNRRSFIDEVSVRKDSFENYNRVLELYVFTKTVSWDYEQKRPYSVTSSESALEGKLFVEFIALIYLSHIKKKMEATGLFTKYTLHGVLDDLDVIECFAPDSSWCVSGIQVAWLLLTAAFSIKFAVLAAVTLLKKWNCHYGFLNCFQKSDILQTNDCELNILLARMFLNG